MNFTKHIIRGYIIVLFLLIQLTVFSKQQTPKKKTDAFKQIENPKKKEITINTTYPLFNSETYVEGELKQVPKKINNHYNIPHFSVFNFLSSFFGKDTTTVTPAHS